MENIFECRQCGQCCEGRGGIILSSDDLARLASFLNQSESFVIAEYAEIANGKRRLKTSKKTGHCVFFEGGRGCLVHEGKPDICRAWPYFRGNLEDAASFEMAREYCPGISRRARHADFAEEGRRYLKRHNLFARTADSASSLLQTEKERG